MLLENLNQIYRTHLEPKLGDISTLCSDGVNSLKNSVGLGEDSTNVFSRGLRTIESAFKTNTCFFKTFVSAGVGLGAYILKEKIPSVPAYLFVGAATGYTIHANFSEIKEEIKSKFSTEHPGASILSIGISAAASYGAYKLLKKFSIVQSAKNAAISALVVVCALELIKRAGTSSTPSDAQSHYPNSNDQGPSNAINVIEPSTPWVNPENPSNQTIPNN